MMKKLKPKPPFEGVVESKTSEGEKNERVKIKSNGGGRTRSRGSTAKHVRDAGMHAVHLCAGLGTIARSCVIARRRPRKLAHCDIDGMATENLGDRDPRVTRGNPGR